MGICVEGLFLEFLQYENTDGTAAHAVSVACGRAAYSIFLDEKQNVEDVLALNVGDKIKIQARPYVNKNGRLAWRGGVLVHGDK